MEFFPTKMEWWPKNSTDCYPTNFIFTQAKSLHNLTLFDVEKVTMTIYQHLNLVWLEKKRGWQKGNVESCLVHHSPVRLFSRLIKANLPSPAFCWLILANSTLYNLYFRHLPCLGSKSKCFAVLSVFATTNSHKYMSTDLWTYWSIINILDFSNINSGC